MAGRVRCIFHAEKTPSLSVDLARGLFHCFGCGVEGGWSRFLEMVGERPEARPVEREPTLVERALAQPWARPGVVESYHRADEARGLRRRADECRRYARDHPLDDDARWALLADAAWYETEAHRLEEA